MVLFESFSTQKKDEHFAAGLTELPVVNLSRFQDIRTTGPLVLKSPGQPETSLLDLAVNYKSRFGITGSVQRSGRAIRITVQLIGICTNEALWAERYDRPTSP